MRLKTNPCSTNGRPVLATRIIAVGGAVTVAVALGACSDDDEGVSGGIAGGGDYCELVESFNQEYVSLGNDDFLADESLMDDVLERVRNIAGSAPDDIKDDWATMADAFDQFAAAAAEVRPENLAELEPEEQDKLKEQLSESMAQVEAEFDDLQGAGERVETHVQEECDVTFN